MESPAAEGAQFSVRGMFAFVAACSLVALLLRFSTMSFSVLATGFATGLVLSLAFLGVTMALDAIERNAQRERARRLARDVAQTEAAVEDAVPAPTQ